MRDIISTILLWFALVLFFMAVFSVGVGMVAWGVSGLLQGVCT